MTADPPKTTNPPKAADPREAGGARGGAGARGGVESHVLARARGRVLGGLSVPVSEPVPPGMLAATDGGLVWVLPAWPDGATPALLEEYETAPMPLDRSGQARRVLAAALRCCWTRLDDAPWPGSPATVADVLQVYADMSRGDTDLARRWATGELRRLSDTGWLLLDEPAGTVRPGPRVALWPEASLASLRDLLRRLPAPAQAGAQVALEAEDGSAASSAPPLESASLFPDEPAAAPPPPAVFSAPVDNPPSEPGAATPDVEGDVR